jgi:hypothetical protein
VTPAVDYTARVSKGLDKVMLLPAHSGYLELGGGWNSHVGPGAYAEAGYKPIEWLGLFGRGELDRSGSRVFGGLRVTF